MNISTSTIQQPRRKPAQNLIDEEDASQLRLGPEFGQTQINHDGEERPLITLNLSETRLLIDAALRARKQKKEGTEEITDDMGDEDEEFYKANEVLRKTREYLNVFSRFRDENTVMTIESLLKSPEHQNLHPFEVAQLGSLACEEAEEAKTLIPSLTDKINDVELQRLLDDMRKYG